MSCWGRGPATGSPPLPRGKGAALFFFMKLEGAFFWFLGGELIPVEGRGVSVLCG